MSNANQGKTCIETGSILSVPYVIKNPPQPFLLVLNFPQSCLVPVNMKRGFANHIRTGWAECNIDNVADKKLADRDNIFIITNSTKRQP